MRILIPVVLCLGALIMVSRTVPDVDLWGHVTFGRDILASGAIPTADPYSFTSDLPWINHEWLAEAVLGWMYEAFGPSGLTSLRWGILGLLFALVWWHLRQLGTSTRSAISLLAFVALLTYPRTQHVRPQLFSVLAFAGLLAALKQAERGRRWLLYAVPLLLIVWANLHGGWIVGIGTLGLWAAVKACQHDARRLGLVAGAVAIVSLAVTLANPYGTQLWEFFWRTVRFNRDDIVEWHPMMRAGFGVMSLWLITSVLAAAAMWRRRGVSNIADVTLICALGLASLRVSRLDAFFAVAVVMLLGDRLLSMSPEPVGTTSHGHRQSLQARPVVVLGTLIPLGLLMLTSAPRQLTCIDLAGAEWLPEREAIEFLRSSHLRGKVLTFFDWGEYAIWHLSPSIKVSMDGRRETIYSNRQIVGHLMVYANRPEGINYIRSIAPDHLWLPAGSPIIQVLRQEGWGERFIGPRSLILSRVEKSTPVIVPASIVESPRCFPGP